MYVFKNKSCRSSWRRERSKDRDEKKNHKPLGLEEEEAKSDHSVEREVCYQIIYYRVHTAPGKP